MLGRVVKPAATHRARWRPRAGPSLLAVPCCSATTVRRRVTSLALPAIVVRGPVDDWRVAACARRDATPRWGPLWRRLSTTGSPAALKSRAQEAAAAASTGEYGDYGEWEVVVGLEVHAQILARSKLFSGASAAYDDHSSRHPGSGDGDGARDDAHSSSSTEVAGPGSKPFATTHAGSDSDADSGADSDDIVYFDSDSDAESGSAAAHAGADSADAAPTPPQAGQPLQQVAHAHAGMRANACVALFDAALPGTLPRTNAFAVEQAVATGLALGGEVRPRSVFERKHYYYADLPHGYQITQLRHPIVEGGALRVDVPLRDDTGRRVPHATRRALVRINRVQLETDSGKSSHTLHPQHTLVDLNRAGMALMEIVGEPDIRSADEAGAFLRKLQAVLRHAGTCDGNMEEGSMRCDVNVSVRRRPGADAAAQGGHVPYGERVEMKNLNSVRAVVRAVQYEAQRQVGVLRSGGSVQRETRTFDADTGRTARLRSKEDAVDYRFFPEPDLPPVEVPPQLVAAVRRRMPEALDSVEDRLVDCAGPYRLTAYDAAVLVGEPGAAQMFEAVVAPALRGRGGGDDSVARAKAAANWICNELFGRLRAAGLPLSRSPMTAAHVADLVDLLHEGAISGKIGKRIADELFSTAGAGAGAPVDVSVRALVEERGWAQISDAAVLRALAEGVVRDPSHARMLKQYVGGKASVLKAFQGKVMAASRGRANPQLANAALLKALEDCAQDSGRGEGHDDEQRRS